MQGSTRKFAEIRLTQNRLNYAETRTPVNPDEHALSDLKSVQCGFESHFLCYRKLPIYGEESSHISFL